MIDRRAFLSSVAAALALEQFARRCAGSTGVQSPALLLERIGVQLYTLRSEMAKGVAPVLERVAEIGYREVEFAGYFNHTPAQLRALLAQYGLTAPSTHVGLGKVPDEWQRAVADAAAIGCTYATVPWLDASQLRTSDDWKRMAKHFNEAARVARSAGLRFAYHNHDFELRRVDDRTALDILVSETDPALVSFEMDIYWVVKGGRDPLALLERYPGRFTMAHAKDATAAPERAMADVGAGTIDFARVLAAGRKQGMAHVFVEHDRPADPWASVTRSYQALRGL